MRVSRLLVRMTVGLLFVGHGTQKLFGWFGGGGPEATAKGFESLELRPGKRYALAAGTAEAAGGALFALGLATPLATAALSSVMITAVRKVHAPKGIWVSEGGFEYNAVLLSVLFGLTEVGPGPLSLDAVLGTERRGLRWAVAELALGALGSFIVTEGARSASARAQADERVPAAA
ncbi:MAG TPA: DoxX family protein [Gaiellaceae bacterium]|nr:DoxX family protein [Gaiellaceae bacterium]